MSNKKQTAVEWLVDQLLNNKGMVVISTSTFYFNEEIVKQALTMEKERIYSEEEVFNLCREFAVFVQHNGPSYKKQQEWFEQNKKA